MTSTTIQTPPPVPARDLPPPQKLSEKDQAEYDRVLAHFSHPDYVLPGVDAEKGSLMEEERMWLSYECILRFMRTTKHNASQCISYLEGTLKWRRDFGLYSLAVTPGPTLEAEAATGNMFLYGYDSQGRPVLYYYPGKRTTKDDLQLLQYFFWTMERAIELMGPGVDSVTIMADFANSAIHPSFYVSAQAIYILRNHYPEYFGPVALVRSTWLLNAFWDFTLPLLGTQMHAKLSFDTVSDEGGIWRSASARDKGEPEAMMVTSSELLNEGFSGSVPFEYEHAVYWPALLAMCEKRRKELTQVWQKLGGVVGIREWDVRVGVRDGLTTVN